LRSVSIRALRVGCDVSGRALTIGAGVGLADILSAPRWPYTRNVVRLDGISDRDAARCGPRCRRRFQRVARCEFSLRRSFACPTTMVRREGTANDYSECWQPHITTSKRTSTVSSFASISFTRGCTLPGPVVAAENLGISEKSDGLPVD
jgi:hypothetical protein